MRSGSALLVVLLLGSLQLSSSAPAGTSVADCCSTLATVKIPLRMVVSYTRTRSDCALKAIVFKTRLGRKFCVDPDTEWVISHIASKDAQGNKRSQ